MDYQKFVEEEFNKIEKTKPNSTPAVSTITASKPVAVAEKKPEAKKEEPKKVEVKVEEPKKAEVKMQEPKKVEVIVAVPVKVQ